MRFLLLLLLLTGTMLGATYTTTATPGTWDIGGSPGSTDNIVIAHDWSSYNQNSIANYTGTLTINAGCYFKINGSITTWTNPIINIGTGATFLVTGDVLVQSSSITVTCNGTWRVNGNFSNSCSTAWAGNGNLVVDGAYAGNGCDLGSVTLPVELGYFKVVGNRLEWITYSEINNDHFEVLYSTDGNDFVTDTVVQGNGNSNHIIVYTSRISKAGYYRLKQVDFDGTPTLFNTVYVASTDRTKLVARYDIVGNSVSDDYSGVLIEVYANGDVIKRVINK